jgi:hypothetical protein
MNAAETHAPQQRAAGRSLGAYVWFLGVAGLWTAFGIVALASADKLADLWGWVTGLPLIAEIVVWIALFPWVLGLWVSQTSWPEWPRILLVASFAVGWTLVSIPRPRNSDALGEIQWEVRSGDPHDVAITRNGIHHAAR